ncbi:MAG: Hint domain-containing protein [Pseudomonadota bacterium]|uniref:Hint domain-containing protein n=1 Tax=Roseovarius TaxID=74030 RepID=UPI0022A6EA03|nr:Hint domain-containing protein [Roseovarius sp. EGI FJ00037]MCZ0811754.1 Hint domain-containing protein [Roseovarius sp. EGI FJ00037]
MPSYDLLLYNTNSVTQYSETNVLSTPESSFFPNSSTGDNDADGATVTFGNLNGEVITVDDDDATFEDGDVGLIGAQTSTSSTSLFNLDGGIEPEYAYTLTDPATGESFRIYAVTATDLLIGNTVVGFASERPIDPTVTYYVSYDAPSLLGSTPDSDPTVAYSSLICFARGSLIDTDRGPVAVEDLGPGDPVVTLDHGCQPIRWIGRRCLSRAEIRAAPHMRPIRIRAGSLGESLPTKDLMVPQQHRMLVRSTFVKRMFAAGEVLVAAKHLLALDGVEIVEEAGEVEYFHLLFDRHEIIFANGALTESLYTGPMAMRSLCPQSRAEILELFPELRYMSEPPRPIRQFSSARKGQQLARRHQKNGKAVVEIETTRRDVAMPVA